MRNPLHIAKLLSPTCSDTSLEFDNIVAVDLLFLDWKRHGVPILSVIDHGTNDKWRGGLPDRTALETRRHSRDGCLQPSWVFGVASCEKAFCHIRPQRRKRGPLFGTPVPRSWIERQQSNRVGRRLRVGRRAHRVSSHSHVASDSDRIRQVPAGSVSAAAPNAPGQARCPKRWKGFERLLSAGFGSGSSRSTKSPLQDDESRTFRR